MSYNRNQPVDFAQLTRKNLRFIKHAYKLHKNQDAHVVTQLMNSLLGIIIVPDAKHVQHHSSLVSLKELQERGWPMWNIMYDEPTGNRPKTETLECLIWHLRNAAAHGRFKFLEKPTSRDLNKVLIQVEDAPTENAQINWRDSIKGDKLYQFCVRLAGEMEEHN